MKKIIRLTESDLTRIVRRVINEQGDPALTYYNDKRKKRGYDTPNDIEERLIILFLMSKGKSRLEAIKELNGSNFESIQYSNDEDIMDWLETIGLKRGDIYINNDNRIRVLNKVKELESLKRK
jgi:hypothetical protein